MSARSIRSGGSLLGKEQKSSRKRRIEAQLSWPTCESLTVPSGVLALARVGIDEKFLSSFLAASALDPPVCPGWMSRPVRRRRRRQSGDSRVISSFTNTLLPLRVCVGAYVQPPSIFPGGLGARRRSLRAATRVATWMSVVFNPSWARWRWPSRALPAPAWRHPRRPSSLSRTPPNRTSGGAPSPARAPSAPQRGRPWRAGRRRSR